MFVFACFCSKKKNNNNSSNQTLLAFSAGVKPATSIWQKLLKYSYHSRHILPAPQP